MSKQKIIQIVVTNSNQIIALTNEGKIYCQKLVLHDVQYVDENYKPTHLVKQNIITGEWTEVALPV